MNLDEAQRKQVAEWVAQGQKLSEIQSRLAAELGLRLTYMEVRLLVDDLKLVPKDTERPKPDSSPLTATPATGKAPPPASAAAPGQKPPEPAPAQGGGVNVSVDQLTRAGALVSGKVTFSDGQRAEWYLDQSGRLGLIPQQAGYRPPPNDIPQFQAALDSELARMGF